MPPASLALLMPGNQRLDAGGVPRLGIARENVLAHRLLRLRALDVDDRRFAGDRDRFLERADFQVAIHVATKEPVSSMPSRLTVLKPGSVNVTE